MDENRFWAMIEAAWGAAGGKAKPRQRLAEGKLSAGRAYALQEALEEEVAPALREQLDALSADELLAFDRILERKLYDLDRADIHERTDGSDDGFLYCRGFIVGMGRAYYEAVRANPDVAVDGRGVRGDVLPVVAPVPREVRRGAAVRHLAGVVRQPGGMARGRRTRRCSRRRGVIRFWDFIAHRRPAAAELCCSAAEGAADVGVVHRV